VATQPAVAPPAVSEAKQLPFSFLSLVKKTGTLPKTSRSRTIDALTAAKGKVLGAIDTQEQFVRDVMDGKALPKGKSGDKTVSTWFSKQNDGWWTSIRYGQAPIPIGEKGETDMLISDKLADVLTFYGAVKIAIGKGELDAQIGKLQAEKSAALKGGKRAA
jgi:hypothetical protein